MISLYTNFNVLTPAGKRKAKQKLDKIFHRDEVPPPPPDTQPPDPGPSEHPAEPAAPAERAARVELGPHRVTPIDFRTLLPKSGKVPGMSGKHDATKKFFSIVYPCQLASIHCTTSEIFMFSA